jgi:hypothetical protein
MAGTTGAGKSYQVRRLIRSAIVQGIEVDVFDAHEDLGFDHPQVAVIKYSRATGYGYNPLELNLDEHSGGVQAKINEFVKLINTSTTQLGTRQEAALRNLLADLYHASGCYEDNPASWRKESITEAVRAQLLSERNYAALRGYFPTIEDLISYGERKISQLHIGTDNKSHASFAALTRLVGQRQQLRVKRTAAHARGDLSAVADLDKKIEDQCAKAIEAYGEAVKSMETGREYSDLLKYDSVDVLRGVLDRIRVISASGTMRANPPPVGNALVRIHQIMSLSEDEQKLFVYRRLEHIYRRRRDAGEQKELLHAIIMDEAHKFVRKDSDAIENKLAIEARKFGLGLWFISQTVGHFTDDFVMSCATTLVIGLHPLLWREAIAKLKISEATLRTIRPQFDVALRTMRKGAAFDTDFGLVGVRESDVRAAFQALAAA